MDSDQFNEDRNQTQTGVPGSYCNRLVREKSPYLLQHAHNPVAWYPWGEDAFARARAEQKPIFLSIGYSTCHWCHVMEHESFEDPEVAKLLNEVVVAVKVDREERPDVDGIYMQACQLLTGSGGWPLSIFMTPDKKPFYAATYIPKQSRMGILGMLDLLPRIQEIWTTRREDVLKSAEEIASVLLTPGIKEGSRPESTPPSEVDATILQRAFEQLRDHFDGEYGGFARVTKFPTPHNLTFLLRYWKRSGDQSALHMVEKTLSAMRSGGIYDHVGFGFHRYATDRKWLLPHFEKMLYDQALLAVSYLEAFQATGKTCYAQTAREIFTYVLRDLTGPEGGFYSAEDADSEGSEGKFYLWTEAEVRGALTPDEANVVIAAFDIQKSGNFEAHGETGMNIFHLGSSLADLAQSLSLSEDELFRRLDAARERLFAVRERRIHPHKDDKILTDWNGLMIAALARGGQVLGSARYAESARKAASFILHNLRSPEGRLIHRYRDGQAAIAGMVDDYAFFIWGLIELYEATWEAQFLDTALDLTTAMITHFWDEKGCFYFTADDAEPLVVRLKESYDGALPSGNSVAMLNLLRLSRLTADSTLEQKALQIAEALSQNLAELPSAYTHLLGSIDFAIGPVHEVVIVGNRDDARDMLDALYRIFIPNKVVIVRDPKDPTPAMLAPYLKDYQPIGGKATAYICRNYRCNLPTTDIHHMIELLKTV